MRWWWWWCLGLVQRAVRAADCGRLLHGQVRPLAHQDLPLQPAQHQRGAGGGQHGRLLQPGLMVNILYLYPKSEYKTKQTTTTILPVGHQEVYYLLLNFQCLIDGAEEIKPEEALHIWYLFQYVNWACCAFVQSDDFINFHFFICCERQAECWRWVQSYGHAGVLVCVLCTRGAICSYSE